KDGGIRFASGSTSVTQGVLGRFDPTNLQNGFSDVRLTVEDTAGNVATAVKEHQADVTSRSATSPSPSTTSPSRASACRSASTAPLRGLPRPPLLGLGGSGPGARPRAQSGAGRGAGRVVRRRGRAAPPAEGHLRPRRDGAVLLPLPERGVDLVAAGAG